MRTYTTRQCRNIFFVREGNLPVCHACQQDWLHVQEACFSHTTPTRSSLPVNHASVGTSFPRKKVSFPYACQQDWLAAREARFYTPRHCRNKFPAREGNIPVCHACQQDCPRIQEASLAMASRTVSASLVRWNWPFSPTLAPWPLETAAPTESFIWY